MLARRRDGGAPFRSRAARRAALPDLADRRPAPLQLDDGHTTEASVRQAAWGARQRRVAASP